MDTLGYPTGGVGLAERGRVRTYVEGLDPKIGGGIPEGFLVLVSGPTGSLKSTFVFRIFAKEAEAGRRALFLTLEQSKESLMYHIRSLGVKSADKVQVADLAELRRDVEGKIGVAWTDALLQNLHRFKKERGLDLLAVDSLDALVAAARIENPRLTFFELFENWRAFGATTFLISEQERGSKVFGRYGVEEFLADGIVHLALREVEHGTRTTMRRFIGVAKMRATGHTLEYFPLLVKGADFSVVTE